MHSQMNCDTLTPQIVHTQHAAYNVSSQVVKYQYLPYWISILVENCSRLGGGSIRCWVVIGGSNFRDIIVEAEDSFDGRWIPRVKFYPSSETKDTNRSGDL